MSFRSSEYCVSASEEIVPYNPASPSEYAVTIKIVYNCVAMAVGEDQSSIDFPDFLFNKPRLGDLVGVLFGESVFRFHRSINGSTSFISSISTPFLGDRFAGFGFVGVLLLFSKYGDHRFPPATTFGVFDSFQLMNQL